MHVKFHFNNINCNNGTPLIRININNEVVYDGCVLETIHVTSINNPVDNIVCIEFLNKNDADTVVNADGQIVSDKNFTLSKIYVEGYDLEELIWESVYYLKSGKTIPSCLFFGPAGYWQINFQLPIVKWMLATRHSKNNNDPTWYEDYQFFEDGCNLIYNK